jgi:hypothetical protein
LVTYGISDLLGLQQCRKIRVDEIKHKFSRGGFEFGAPRHLFSLFVGDGAHLSFFRD